MSNESVDVIKDLAKKAIEFRYPGQKGKAIAFLLFGGYGVPGLVDDGQLIATGAFSDDPMDVAKEFTGDMALALVMDATADAIGLALSAAGITVTEFAASVPAAFALILHSEELGKSDLPREFGLPGRQPSIPKFVDKPSLIPGGPRVPGIPVNPSPRPRPPTPRPAPSPPSGPRPSPSPSPSSPPMSPEPRDFPRIPRPSPSPSPTPAPEPAPRPEPRPAPAPKPPKPPTPPKPPKAPPPTPAPEPDNPPTAPLGRPEVVDSRPDLKELEREKQLRKQLGGDDGG